MINYRVWGIFKFQRKETRCLIVSLVTSLQSFFLSPWQLPSNFIPFSTHFTPFVIRQLLHPTFCPPPAAAARAQHGRDATKHTNSRYPAKT